MMVQESNDDGKGREAGIQPNHIAIIFIFLATFPSEAKTRQHLQQLGE